MVGGIGDDTYVLDSTSDVIVENSADGIDVIRTGLTSLTMVANVENFVYTGSSTVRVIGSSSNNWIIGGENNDTLDGSTGNDTLEGGLGDDSFIGGTGNDLFIVDSVGDVLVENARRVRIQYKQV